MSQPRISRLCIWEKHEQRIVKVLLAALAILRGETDLPPQEVSLNRELFFCIHEANHKLWESGLGGFSYPPVPEGHNPPDPDDQQRAIRENKVPDFYWSYYDDLEPDPRRSARYYVIECKRLGDPPRPDWVLNQNYVLNGILRFVTEEHGYAKSEQSGAMVGYVQSMELDDILYEVNATCTSRAIPQIDLPLGGWRTEGTSFLKQQLDRTFAVSPFRLCHFWVDIRRS